MENDAMLGGMSGKIRREKPRTRWLDYLDTLQNIDRLFNTISNIIIS